MADLIVGGLTLEEESQIAALRADLVQYRRANAVKWAYYDGEAVLKNMGIAVPDAMINVEAVIGWGEVIVDALDERLDWLGWVSDAGQADGLTRVYRQNRLGTEFDKVKLDSLVTGVGFLEVTAGGEGEPDVIVNSVSSSDATYVWDDRSDRVAAGLVLKTGPGGEELITLYLPDSTVTVIRSRDGEQVRRHVHNRGRCGLVAFPNKSRAGQVRGKSELTKPVRYAIDHATRTILGMEYNREIYTTPQRWFANVEPEDLGLDPDLQMGEFERIKKGFDVAMTRAVILPPQEGVGQSNGPNPSTGAYQSASPEPYIDELKMLTNLLSAYSGIPAAQFGFFTQNPPSAEGQRALEARHVKKAERRCTSYSAPLDNDVAFVAQMILSERYEGEPEPSPEWLASVSSKWGDPATPTVAAATDAVVKQIAAGMLSQQSVVALERAGYSETDIRRVQQEWQQSAFRQLLGLAGRQSAEDPLVSQLSGQRDENEQDALDGREDDLKRAQVLKARADALGTLVRAGVKNSSAAHLAGVEGAEFIPGQPITIRQNEDGQDAS